MNDHRCHPPRIADGQRWTCPTCRRQWCYTDRATSLGEMAPRSQRIRHDRDRGVK